MRKSIIITAILLLSAVMAFAMSNTGEKFKIEKKFLEHSEACLELMAETAAEMNLNGACVVAYIPAEDPMKWISTMKIAGKLQNGSANFLAIAYSKAAEMADTHKNSGTVDREPMHGEFGYQGGVIKKITSGYLITVFSGGTGEQDIEIAEKGLELLVSALQDANRN